MKKNNTLCHVCGMSTTDMNVPFLKYHKIYFYFCSQQCRETFNAHPSLYSVAPKAQRKNILKQRTIRLAEDLEPIAADCLKSCFLDMMGIKEVIVAGNKITLHYDLLQVTRQQIENRLVEIGIGLGEGWMEKLRRAWEHDSEENELDNLAAPLHFYHRPAAKH